MAKSVYFINQILYYNIIMSEQNRSPEVEPTAEIIADGIDYWLKKEVGSSATGRNRYLDDFDEFRQSLDLPYNDHRNTLTQKNHSHYNRLVLWSGLFAEYDDLDDSQKERVVAQQLFGAQMFLSGIFRIQCFLQATDQEDYYKQRLEGHYIGIDLERTVSDRLAELFETIPGPTDFNKPMSLQELKHHTLAMNEQQRHCIKDLCENGSQGAAQEGSPAATAMTDVQKGWVDLIVDYIAFAASDGGGDLSTVPFLEPKSISDDPQIYYPFAAEVS